jgi:hypothetical protein
MTTMSRNLIWLASIGGAILAVALCVPLGWHVFSLWAAGLHQRSVTHSLAAWEREFQQLRDLKDAGRAVDMLEYVGRYYPVADGYRSFSATETALESQRAKTTATIVAALRDFSGQDFGTNVTEWHAWVDEQKPTQPSTK